MESRLDRDLRRAIQGRATRRLSPFLSSMVATRLRVTSQPSGTRATARTRALTKQGGPRALTSKITEAEATDTSPASTETSSTKPKSVLKTAERVQHAVSPSQAEEDDVVVSICAALHEEMGPAFSLSANDIRVREHVLTIQPASETFDEIEVIPCTCAICSSGGNHGEACDEDVIPQSVLKSVGSSQMDDLPLHTRVDERDIEEHTTLLLQSLRAYLGADEFRRALGPSAEDFSTLCSLRDDELRICVVVNHDQYDRALAYFNRLQVNTHSTAHVRRMLAKTHGVRPGARFS